MKPTELEEFLKTYSREFFKPDQSNDELPPALFVWGPPGIGKSSIIRQVTESLNIDFVDIRMLIYDPTDLRGIPVPDDGQAKWLPASILPSKDGKGIILYDELNCAPVLVANSALQLILDRKLDEYTLPKGYMQIAAGNREGEAFVHKLSPPLLNRFVHINLDLDVDDWAVWAVKHSIRPEIVGFLQWRPELLFKFNPAKHERSFPTPRTYKFASRLLDFTPEPMLLEMMSGAIGEGAAVEFIAFTKTFNKIPDIKRILEGEDNTVPDGIDIKYALISALASAATEKHCNRLLKYSYNLPKEFATVLVKLLLGKLGRPTLEKAPEWSKWAREFISVIK